METLVYDNLTVPVHTDYVPATREEPEEYITKDYTDSFEYSVPANDVATTIFENFLTDEEYYELAESEDNDKLAWKNLLSRYDEFVEKHYDELLDYYREAAEEAAKDDFQDRYDDRGFDEGLTKKSMLEELEDPDTYRFRLMDCPECGASRSYDHETGICIGCGFNFNLTEEIDPDVTKRFDALDKKIESEFDALYKDLSKKIESETDNVEKYVGLETDYTIKAANRAADQAAAGRDDLSAISKVLGKNDQVIYNAIKTKK